VAKAEAHLCALATRHRPSDLRRLARHLLDVVAPEVTEEAEARAIARMEAHAEAKATLSITPLGDGTSRLFALLPEAVGERLRTYLDSFAQPRITALETDGRIRPRNRIMADAFAQLLETIDPHRLPAHGGDATTVIVTIPLHHLQRELGVAHLGATPITAQPGKRSDTAQVSTTPFGAIHFSPVEFGGTTTATRPPAAQLDAAQIGTTDLAGTPISAGEARRLACTAGIIPAILGGKSEPLDLGRTRRLFTPAQRKALKIRDQHCRAEGCTVPATWCDAHHQNPWSQGGNTDLTDGILLCGHHHRRAHDPTYHTTRLPNGDHRYHRRT
jgi:hypothetical protein